MSFAGATAATACVTQVYGDSVFGRLLGQPKVVGLHEREAKTLRVGGYLDREGKLWRIVKITPSRDWFDPTVFVHLKNWTNQGIPSLSATREKVAWLEDEAPGLTKAHQVALERSMFFGDS